MLLREIASRIHEHLRRFEADKETNQPNGEYGLQPYFNASAVSSGRYVYVTYVSYQRANALKRDEAEKYLAWLDAGNVGKHLEAGE